MKPIEITDALVKTDLVQRVHQNQKLGAEALNQFQKTVQEKLDEQVNSTPRPVPREDEVVLNVRGRHRREGEQRRRDADGKPDDADEPPRGQGPGDGHIDIKI